MKFAFILIVIAFMAYLSCMEISSADLFWHLRMGEDFLKHGMSPFVDHYSFTFRDAPIRMVAWPFQVLISSLYAFAGLTGIALYRFLSWSLGLFFLLKILNEKNGTRVSKIVATLFFLLAALYRAEPRPEPLSTSLELVTIWLCLWWRRTDSYRPVAFLILLMWLWSNYHVSSALGYVCVGGFLIERMTYLVINRAPFTRWKSFLLVSLILIGVGFFNHDLIHPLLLQLYLSPLWSHYIGEYQQRPFSLLELYLQIYWILTLISIPFLLKRKEFAGLVVVVVMAVKTWTLSKLFPHFIVMTLPFVIESLCFYATSPQEPHPIRNRIPLTTAGLIVTVILIWQLALGAWLHPVHPIRLTIDTKTFPVDTAEFAKSEKLEGRVINDYDIGGYLIQKLAPEMSDYIDGRTSILFPVQFMEHYTSMASDSKIFVDDVHKYGVNWVLAPLSKSNHLFETALNSKQFQISFVGQNSALLSDKPTPFPISSRSFLHPECLERATHEQINQELKRSEGRMPLESPLTEFLKLANQYYTQHQTRVFEDPAVAPEKLRDPSRRLLAALAIKESKFQTALAYYASIENRSQDDKVLFAEADCQYNGCRNSEAILNTVTVPGLRDDHVYRAYTILKKLHDSTGLRIFTEERFLKNKAKVDHLFAVGGAPGAPNWCD